MDMDEQVQARIDAQLKKEGIDPEAASRMFADLNAVSANFVKAISNINRYESLPSLSIDPLDPRLWDSDSRYAAVNVLFEMKLGAVKAKMTRDKIPENKRTEEYHYLNNALKKRGIYTATLEQLQETLSKHWPVYKAAVWTHGAPAAKTPGKTKLASAAAETPAKVQRAAVARYKRAKKPANTPRPVRGRGKNESRDPD